MLPPPPSADTTDLNMRSTTVSEEPPGAAPAANGLNGPHPDRQPASALDSAPAPLAPSIRFQNFAYSGANDYCMFCETGFLSVGGGGGGRFGLWLNDSLSRGHSAPCDTFANQALSDEGEKFDVLGVELWVVGASGG